jgi:hypothetical protein
MKMNSPVFGVFPSASPTVAGTRFSLFGITAETNSSLSFK